MGKQSKYLRTRTEQHKPKNTRSKETDAIAQTVALMVIDILNREFEQDLKNRNYYLERETSMSYEQMFYMIKKRSNRDDMDINYADRTIRPDGGFIFVRSHDDPDFYFPILIIEMKVQGTNDIRLSEGKKKQAQGNAIERLGKNLSIVRTLFASEGVTPFVCFGHGCDFDLEFAKGVKTVLGKVIGMNQFFPLNTIYVNRVETKNSRGVSSIYQPVSMFFRRDEWKVDEMLPICERIAKTALQHLMY